MTFAPAFSRSVRAALRRWRDAARHDERGNQAITAVLVYPILLVFVFGIFQGALYMHARNVAQHAANGAVQAARLEGATDADGVAAAQVRLAAAEGVVLSPTVSVSRSAVEVTVEIRGTVPSKIPLIRGWSLEQTATGPVERWIEP
jgi:Flp pilus assembly protein TadG